MRASEIYLGRVVGVDVNNFTVDVELNNGANAKEIQVSTGFFNSKEGSGIIGHPELDSLCLVAKIDNGEYVIIGFIASLCQKKNAAGDDIIGDSGFRSERPLWRAGDVGLVGPSGNSVVVESSGLVHLIGSHLSQIYLVPDPANMIKMITDNLIFDIGYNRISLENNRVLNQSNFTFKIKPNANDKDSSDEDIEIKIGKQGNMFNISIGGTTVLNISPNRTVTVNNHLIVRP